jgi:hypothetical protein
MVLQPPIITQYHNTIYLLIQYFRNYHKSEYKDILNDRNIAICMQAFHFFSLNLKDD